MTQLLCLALVPGCEICARPGPRRDDKHRCDDLCHLFAKVRTDAEFHDAIHRAQHCRGCGVWGYDETGASINLNVPCRYGTCINWACPICGHEAGGYGPLSCPCKTSWWTRLWFRLKGQPL